MDSSLLAVHHRLNTDLQFFATHAPMLIKEKVSDGGDEDGERFAGPLRPIKFNRAQLHIHACLEKQKREKGWVRALLLKGRQQGSSTYVGLRFYHGATRRPGTSVFILSHEGKTTDKLFKMVERYHNNCNPVLRPEVGTSNRNQLSFPGIESDYAVGTAGNENVGRGGTAQLFHGSEVAYWENADAIQDGALESIALMPGTEIILESTADGPKGLFYRKCKDAMHGRGDYILIFVPWFWQDEYEREYNGEELTPEEELYAENYLLEFPREKQCRKILWRRYKIIDICTADNIESGEAKFRRIYPSNPTEAFQSSGVGLVRADAIIAARKSVLTDEGAVLIGGVDPAGDSDSSDRTVIALRRGRHFIEVLKYPRMKPMELAGILIKLMRDRGVGMFFVDRGYGEGTIDRCRELGWGRQVQGVAFNERPTEPDRYLNKRSEMIITAAGWINAGGVRIPDDTEVHDDLACMPIDEETSNGLKFLKSKREIRKILGQSPDIFDALALTFAYPVRRTDDMTNGGGGVVRKAEGSRGGPLKSLARLHASRSRSQTRLGRGG